ncbi:MAG TPA: hypothetical protein VGX03_25475 [Candidatus Binatia bacterium]|nr:hypothetical protein [Candidatus Binatia bacterium]
MGYMQHHAIIVTSCINEKFSAAYKKAKELFPKVSDPVPSGTNGYYSFFIPPDGSKEGWEASDAGDERRRIFRGWLNSQAYEDGSNSLKWVEVQYGDDEGDNCVLASDEDFYRERDRGEQ